MLLIKVQKAPRQKVQVDEAMTYREARMQAAKQLAAAGVENEAAESWFLMEAACAGSAAVFICCMNRRLWIR